VKSQCYQDNPSSEIISAIRTTRQAKANGASQAERS
jgi:hypothetical protein